MKFIQLIITSLLLFSFGNLYAGDRYALVMGSNYKGNSAGISELNLCEADATYIKSQIQKVGKFKEVSLLLGKELTKANIKKAIQDLAKKADKDDTVFLYFAGHGFFMRDPSAKNGMRNYIVCYDRPHLADDELNDYLKEIKSPKTLFAFDCCFSGGIAKKGQKTRGNAEIPIPEGSQGTVKQNPEDFYFQNKAIISSSDDDQTSIEIGGRINHGVFTYNFGRAIENADLNGDKVVTALEAFFQTKEEVQKMAAKVNHQQVPQVSGDASGIFLSGQKEPKPPEEKKKPEPEPPSIPEPDVNPPKPDPVKPVVTPDEPPVVDTGSYGDLLIRSTIIVDRSFGRIDRTPEEMIKRRNDKGARRIKVFISDKEYAYSLKTRKSRFWGASSIGGNIKQGAIYDILVKEVPAGVHKIVVQADDYPEIQTTFAILKNQKNILKLRSSMSGYGA
ncbi:MAG: caspase family protein, partial [Leptospiraceae bacterium]|nr:caspase family protein [Leptospiraceae bacterium]